MLTVLPYETSFGTKIATDHVKKELEKYIGIEDISKLQYEYNKLEKTKVIFIIGKNNTEKELPMWDHPLLVKTLRDGEVIAVDLRKYVKAIKEDEGITTIASVAKDENHIKHIVLRAMLTCEFIDKNYALLTPLMKNLTASYAYVVSSLLTSAVSLTPVDLMQVEYATALYLTIIANDSMDVDYMLDVAAVRCASAKLSGSTSNSIIRKVYDKLPVKELVEANGKSVELLVKLIKYSLPEDKQELIGIETLYNSLISMWYGPGGAEAMVMGLEHLPTWTALTYSAGNDITFKRTRLSTIMDKYKRSIQPAEIEKYFNNYMKSLTSI